MRAFGKGLLALAFFSGTATAQAGLVSGEPATGLQFSPRIATELNTDISLGKLVSPSMQWSQIEIDRLKAEGLNAGLPYTLTAEMMVKSDLIRSFKVAKTETMAPPQAAKYRPLVSLLMLLAGFTMWVGLSFQRRY